jgi:hypothetical protein
MMDINWDLAPEDADSLKMNSRYFVRFFKGNLKYVDGIFTSGFNENTEWKTIATRTTKKTVADEQEDEKWTHTTLLGRCRVLIDTPDKYGYVVIERESGSYSSVYPENLKPIKPTLTKAKFADFVIEKLNDGTYQGAVCYLLQQKLDEHDIIG